MPQDHHALGWSELSSSKRPTRKWIAAVVGGATPIVLSAIGSGSWGRVESGMAVTLTGALVLSWLTRNDPTPGGV